MKIRVIHEMRHFPTIMQSNMLYKEQLSTYQEFEQSIVIALSNNDRIFYRTFNDFNNSNTKYKTCPNFFMKYRAILKCAQTHLYKYYLYHLLDNLDVATPPN